MIDSRIIRFLKRHHVLTVATTINNEPWCASCFYVYLADENLFVFTTDMDTRHGQEFVKNPVVAGAVALETRVIGKIRGVQFQGLVSEPEGDLVERANTAYLKRFPVALLMETHLWVIKPTILKMTDNRLGFGKKLIWRQS
jgi:uncharacterized protein YhbP (UPF0306 family)